MITCFCNRLSIWRALCDDELCEEGFASKIVCRTCYILQILYFNLRLKRVYGRKLEKKIGIKLCNNFSIRICHSICAFKTAQLPLSANYDLQLCHGRISWKAFTKSLKHYLISIGILFVYRSVFTAP